MGVAARL